MKASIFSKLECFSSFSRTQEKISIKFKTVTVSKLFDQTWNNFQENNSLWMCTIGYQTKVCHFVVYDLEI